MHREFFLIDKLIVRKVETDFLKKLTFQFIEIIAHSCTRMLCLKSKNRTHTNNYHSNTCADVF